MKLEGYDVHSCYSTVDCFGEYDGDFGPAGWGADWSNASTVIPNIFTDAVDWNLSKVDGSSGIPDWPAQVKDALTTTDRSAQAAKWHNLNTEAVDQVWIIPLFFDRAQTLAGTNVGGLYRWAPYASWPYAQLFAKAS